MDLKNLIDEAIARGEKMKSDVLSEIFKSKAIQELVSSRKFVKAVTRIIETKEEVKRALNRQVSGIFEMMDVPTKDEVKKIGLQISRIEKEIEALGRKKIEVSTLKSKKSGAALASKKSKKSPKKR